MNSRFCPSPWFSGYVDDTFTMFDSKDNANEFLSFLNSRHDSIKVTIECPENTFSTCLPEEDIHRPLHQSGIHSHLASTKSTSSALSSIDASEFAPRHLYYRPLLKI